MKTILPVVLAVWASTASVGTFVWLNAPERPAADAAPDRTTTSSTIAVVVTGTEGAHYLTFKLETVAEPGATRLVPLEAAARDVLIDAAARTAALGRTDGWQEALETVLRENREKLGVSELSVRRAQRLPAP